MLLSCLAFEDFSGPTLSEYQCRRGRDLLLGQTVTALRCRRDTSCPMPSLRELSRIMMVIRGHHLMLSGAYSKPACCASSWPVLTLALVDCRMLARHRSALGFATLSSVRRCPRGDVDLVNSVVHDTRETNALITVQIGKVVIPT